MTELTKTAWFSLFAVVALLATALLWQNSLLLVFVLVVTGAAMIKIEGSRSAVFIFLLGFVLGPLSELLAMWSGAWSYAQPDVFTIPMWLPFLWGNAGLYISRFTVFLRTLTPDASDQS